MARAARAGVRGFTMTELLAVIAMIGAMAALASPTFINLMRDRRVQRAATASSEVYRLARSRALGRGSAVLVRYNASGGAQGTALIEMREAIISGAAGPVPSTSCLTTNWTNGSATSRAITAFDQGNGAYELAEFSFYRTATTTGTEAFAEICYTPRGRAWMRLDAAGAFAVLADVPRIVVKNKSTGLQRTLFLPPNGVARLAL